MEEPDYSLGGVELHWPPFLLAKIRPQDQVNSANELLKGTLEEQPGIEQVEFAGQLPFSQVQRLREVQIEGEDGVRRLQHSFGSSGLLDLLGVPILQGPSFDHRDVQRAAPVALVDAAAARTLWPAGNALGSRMKLASEDEWRTVVGIVGEIRQTSLRQSPQPVVYLPLEQSASREVSIFIRTANPSVPVSGALGRTVRRLSPEPPVYYLESLSAHVERGFSQRTRVVVLCV